MDGRRQTEEHAALSARTSDGQVKAVTGTKNKNNTHMGIEIHARRDAGGGRYITELDLEWITV
jgi:hypothetical protein